MGSSQRSIEFFYKNFVESSSEEESDGETEILLAVAQMVHDHYLLPPHRGGSSKRREDNQECDREDGTYTFTRTTSIQLIQSLERRHSVTAIGCRETCSCKFLMV
jgi:hypothetical protein